MIAFRADDVAIHKIVAIQQWHHVCNNNNNNNDNNKISISSLLLSTPISLSFEPFPNAPTSEFVNETEITLQSFKSKIMRKKTLSDLNMSVSFLYVMHFSCVIYIFLRPPSFLSTFYGCYGLVAFTHFFFSHSITLSFLHSFLASDLPLAEKKSVNLL